MMDESVFLYVNYINEERYKKNKNVVRVKIKSKIISHFQLKFKEIMALDDIMPEDIISSLDVRKNRNMIFKAGEGAGSSGSFYFFSKDKKFLIKTLKVSERKILTGKDGILLEYIEHIKRTENKSFLARIYGLFTIKTNYYGSIDVMIM